MPTIDRKPEPQRKAIKVAGDCVRRGDTEAAKTIRDLIDLAKALQDIGCAYRNGQQPKAKSLDVSADFSWMIN